MLTLQIIETAYRATLEEQDDPVLWITQAMRAAGGELAVLLRANAVNYAVRAQDCGGLRIGDWKQSQPPRLAADVQGLLAKGVQVFAIEDDLVERGIGASHLIDGVTRLQRARIGELLEQFPRVWHW